MALSADSFDARPIEGHMADLAIAASTVIYEGGLVMIDSNGYATPLSGAGQKFAGVAEERADNRKGGAGDIRVRVRVDQHVRAMPVTGATSATANGLPVYASDDATL